LKPRLLRHSKPAQSADTSTPGINAIQAKVTQVMSSIADIQNLLAAETSAEEKVLAVVQSQSATISTLQSQLATAAAGSDMAGIASVLSGNMQTNIDQRSMPCPQLDLHGHHAD
jgi:hypothetical protein